MAIPPNSYIFALMVGILAAGIAYLDSLQTKKTVTKITYIKVFIGAAILSLFTAAYFGQICKKGGSMVGGSMVGGGSTRMSQRILTGLPDF